MHCAAGLHAILNKRMKAGGRGALDHAHANSTNAFSVRLRRHDNQSLVLNSPAYNTFLGTAPAGFVHLHPIRQTIAAGFEPSRAAVYAATTRRSDNCPIRGLAASPVRWRRSSGWSQTTLPGTRWREASAYPGTRCQPSRKFESRSTNTGTKWLEPATPCPLRNADTEIPPATAIEKDTRDSLLRSRTGPRTLEESAGNLHSATILPVGVT